MIGKGTVVWDNSQIREEAVIGEDCIIGRNVYIDKGVVIGNRVKIQNNALIYAGVTIEDEVFIGPGVIFTNDKFPRSAVDGRLMIAEDWKLEKTLVKKGASIGAGSVVLCGIVIDEGAMVGAGSVVTKYVAPYNIVYGNPARVHGITSR